MAPKFQWLAREMYDEFVHENGRQPLYAECYILFSGEEQEELVTIALFEYDVDTPNDDDIFFYCRDFEELLQLNETDFEVIGVSYFFD